MWFSQFTWWFFLNTKHVIIENIPGWSVITTWRVRPGSGPVWPAITRSWGRRSSPVIWTWWSPVSIPVTISATTSPGTGAGGSAHVHSRGWCMRALSDGKIYSDFFAIKLCIRQSISRFGSILHFLKGHKSKASGSSSFPIQDNIKLLQGAKLAKFFFQLSFCSVQA